MFLLCSMEAWHVFVEFSGDVWNGFMTFASTEATAEAFEASNLLQLCPELVEMTLMVVTCLR